MSETTQRPLRRYGAAGAAGTAVLILGAVAILWSWNTVAGDLFGAPTAAFRHAIATELAVVVVGTAVGFIARLARGGRQTGAVS